MVQRPPSLATVQTPNHPPPPYPFGSQQAGQLYNAMGQGQLQQQQPAGMGQFATPQPKGQQAGPGGVTGPPRPPLPLPSTSGPQSNITAKSPGSSSSPFQQGSPGTPPMMAQRPTTPQGFPQGVGSPGRAALSQQGNMQQGFMGMPQHVQPGAQVHPGMGKRPMGFPNMNFVQGQVSAGTPGTPVGGAPQQLQNNQGITHTGEIGVQQMVPDIQGQQQQGMMGGPQHIQMGNGHFPGHGMNFNPQFSGQMPVGGPCGQPGGFPVSKDVTLTSPLLVNLLQSDISASQFGPGGKQGAEVQRHPVSQQASMPVMINLQGHSSVPPSPDKARGIPLMVNPQLSGAARRMSHPDVGQGPQSSGSEEVSTGPHTKQDRPTGSEIGLQPGNGAQQSSNPQMMKQGPGQTQMPQHTGASPQQQLAPQPQQGGHMPGLHFPNVPTSSQSSRPKTPNRASPRPYHHPLTPTNRPPSTEPSEINLSPERLNASIAGLFPPKINIPLPPRQPNLNRGFDQQGLNPTTLKAIGQAPPSLTLPGNNNNGNLGGNNSNNQQSAGAGVGVLGAKQDKQSGGQNKRASPSNSRRSSPASSRKSATPSPGRQKATKNTINCSPHQQQMVNSQGQTVMLSPSSVPQSPVSMPSQVSGGIETQQSQSSLHGIHGNPVDGFRENQGVMPPEQRQIPQPQAQTQQFRELSSPRITSPRMPTHQVPKPDVEMQANTADRPPIHPATGQDSEVSPALRATPTSLNQLLDNTNILNMSLRPTPTGNDHHKSVLDPERPLSCNSQNADKSTSVVTMAAGAANEPLAVPKSALNPTSGSALPITSIPSSHPPTTVNSSTTLSFKQNPLPNLVNQNVNPVATLTGSVSINTNTSPGLSTSTPVSGQNTSASTVSASSAVNPATSAVKPSPSPKPGTSVQSVIQIPASSSNISPNQITVFVTSNPITTAPTSQVPTSMVRPQDLRHQSSGPRPAQFITTTPVFINPIFQVPASSMAPNSTVVSQSVTMVGSLQVSAGNIHLSHASSSSQTTGATMTSALSNRSGVGQVHIATSMSSSGPISTLLAPQQFNQGGIKTETSSEASSSQKSALPGHQPSPHLGPSVSTSFQPPLASPPPCSSPMAVNPIRKSPVPPSPTAQMKIMPTSATVSVSGKASVPNQPLPVKAQGPVVTVAGTGVSPSTLLSAVPPIQSSVTSVLPIVASSGPGEGSHSTSSPPGIASGVPASQSDAPAAEPSMPSATAPAESTQTIPGTCLASQKNY
ncbi:hypothetical protein GOODEAATRI_010548 [Goodea atripinnis]|uniref:Nuclear receptor coactivator 6 n=1 Tax=Goodea atripinnis TaxID=208336 RepID=A0ABV0PME5_9TELE